MKWSLLCIILLSNCLFSETGFIVPWGKDREMVPSARSAIPPLPEKTGFFTKCAEQVVLFHQNVLSPVDGPRSHFRPTSSRYMMLSMKRYGFIKGYIMGCDRLQRENKEKWVYRTIEIDGEAFKWDPTF